MGYDFPVALSISEMTENAQVVVIGKYSNYDSSWNMARNPSNISYEDSENFTEGHLYAFTVEEVLKGEVSELDILVNHRYSEILKIMESNAEVSNEGIILKEATKENELRLTVHDPLYISPELGVSYILFLMKDEVFGYYYGAIEPFSIIISSDSTVVLRSNLINRTHSFEESVVVNDNRTINVSISGASIEDNISNTSVDTVLQQIERSVRKDGR